MDYEVQIVMPMAGMGTRVLKREFSNTIKPLVEINGVPSFVRALESLKDLNLRKKLFFITLEDFSKEHQIENVVGKYYPQADLHLIKNSTSGPVETCLQIKEYIDMDRPLIIMDCDLYIDPGKYLKEVKKQITSDSGTDGIIPIFESNNQAYGFAKINQDNEVLDIAEKQIISPYAVAGVYFFTRADSFYNNKIVDSAKNISDIYKKLVRNKKIVKAYLVDQHISYGTYESIKKYE